MSDEPQVEPYQCSACGGAMGAHTAECQAHSLHRPCCAAGDRVEICDGSEAHGDKGKVLWVQDDGLIIVELEAGCVWPVTEHELKPHNEKLRDAGESGVEST